MGNWQQELYNHSPWFIRRYLVAMEAARRNRYRRFGDYDQCRSEYSFNCYEGMTLESIREEQTARLHALLVGARRTSSFHRSRMSQQVADDAELDRIPIMTKADVRENQNQILDPAYDARQLWNGLTSGSTGTPLRFPVGREGIRARTAIQDNYYELHGCRYGERRIRFGGAKIVPVHVTEPPFWIHNSPDNQLQMSAYHIDQVSLPLYVATIEEYAPVYITGYAHAQFQVAQYLCEIGGLRRPPRATFTDSEGLPPEYHATLERGFGAPSYDVYGLGEVGWVAVQCEHYKYHTLELSCVLEAVDDDGCTVPAGAPGRLVVTDLTQGAFPYIRYDTGDVGVLANTSCSCGLQTGILESIDGRNDDLIVTPRGRKVGRLSHVTKPGRGILESQIVQTSQDSVVIRVVPGENFDHDSMRDVVQVAHELLGDEMDIAWELVDRIPRTARHKFKHVVREVAV